MAAESASAPPIRRTCPVAATINTNRTDNFTTGEASEAPRAPALKGFY